MKLFRVSIVQRRGTARIRRAQAQMFAATPKGRAFLRRKSKPKHFPNKNKLTSLVLDALPWLSGLHATDRL
jgi:hypothetical protein